MPSRIITFKEAIREAQDICLSNNKTVFVIGEGVPDPKAVFGTTAGLQVKYPKQIYDMPVSENGLTGVCIGAAASGLRPILVHQRIDFSLYSADQIINMAAKLHSMYGGQLSCPLVIRMIVGRGWGQGNQHSQSLQSLYAHVPGLKIVCPSNAFDAKGLFIRAVRDPNPVLFIEHRWLYDTTSDVPEKPYEIDIGRIRKDPFEADVVVISSGHATLESKIAIRYLSERGVKIEHIDLHTLRPLDMDTIKRCVYKTARVVVAMDEWEFGGVASEIIASLATEPSFKFKVAARRVTYPNFPSASSPHLTKDYYPGPYQIARAINDVVGASINYGDLKKYQNDRTHDVPDKNFRGPF